MSTRVPAEAFSLSAKQSVAKLEELFGAVLEEALLETGTTKTAAADELGMKRPHLYAYLGVDAAKRLPAAWLFRLPKPALVALLNRFLEARGLLVVEMPEASTAATEIALLEAVHKETSEAVAAVFVALRKMHWTRALATVTRKECLEAVRALLALVAICDVVEREGVLAVGREPEVEPMLRSA